MPASPKLPRKPPERHRCKCGCGRMFKPARPWQKFFSPQCKRNYHNLGPAFGALEHRGLERLVKLSLAQVNAKLPTLVKAHLQTKERTIRELLERIEALEHIVKL